LAEPDQEPCPRRTGVIAPACCAVAVLLGWLGAGGMPTLAWAWHARADDAAEQASDLIVFKPGVRYTGELSIEGTIVDYTGSEITILLKNGQRRSFPTAEVLRYETTRTDSWQQAEEHFEAHEYLLAATDFGHALDEERRPWVRREILARLAWCYRLQGDGVRAGETFLALYESDPETPFFSAIELAWVGGETPPELAERARQWLRRDDSPVARLMGASHLLSGADRAVAVAALRELMKQPDERLAILAAAQVWRTQVGQADENQLRRWEDVIRRLPSTLRAGPYFVIGKGYALGRLPEQAALKFLWLPLVYNEDPMLAAEACLEAADALAAAGQQAESQSLYREVVVKYGFTPAARAARLHLQGLTPPPSEARAGAG
jgi:signal peptidase II